MHPTVRHLLCRNCSTYNSWLVYYQDILDHCLSYIRKHRRQCELITKYHIFWFNEPKKGTLLAGIKSIPLIRSGPHTKSIHCGKATHTIFVLLKIIGNLPKAIPGWIAHKDCLGLVFCNNTERKAFSLDCTLNCTIGTTMWCLSKLNVVKSRSSMFLKADQPVDWCVMAATPIVSTLRSTLQKIKEKPWMNASGPTHVPHLKLRCW